MSGDLYRIAPGSDIDLASLDTRDTSMFPTLSKKTAPPVLAGLRKELAEFQRLLWADGNHSLLLVIQAMDTGGKDGTIRKVFSGVNPQGVDVYGFGVPSDLERAHDYLWRIHARTPAKGRIGVFNRSHYEDVLVVRVNNLVPESQWARRYEHIRNFEQMLVDEGTTIVKIVLNISRSEQKERLEARLGDATKNYKFNPTDLDARAKWNDYMLAYSDAINETSTDHAPWVVVPADRKWYRNLVVASTLVETLGRMPLKYPTADFDLAEIQIPD
jgi:PPK2 family polyphosphate:nucleotide phosphotransferase